MTQNAYFSLLAYSKKLKFMAFCDMTVGIGSVTGRVAATGGKTYRYKRPKFMQNCNDIVY